MVSEDEFFEIYWLITSRVRQIVDGQSFVEITRQDVPAPVPPTHIDQLNKKLHELQDKIRDSFCGQGGQSELRRDMNRLQAQDLPVTIAVKDRSKRMRAVITQLMPSLRRSLDQPIGCLQTDGGMTPARSCDN